VASTPLVPAVTVLVGMFPTRRMYRCLKGLHRWGLLDRRPDARGLVIYKISQRGRERLAWLRERFRPERSNHGS